MQPQHYARQQHQSGAKAERQIAVGEARHQIPGYTATRYKQRIPELGGDMFHMIAARSGAGQDGGCLLYTSDAADD